MDSAPREPDREQYRDDQRAFFDRLIIEEWHTYLDAHWDKMRRWEVHRVLALVPRPRLVLDVGCGCGFHDVVLAESPSVERVVAVDTSPRSIEQAERHYLHPKVTRLVADVLHPSDVLVHFGAFDLVASFQVIEHLSRPREFLAACAGYVVEGGYLALVTPNRWRAQNVVAWLRGRPPALMDPLHFTEYTVAELIDMGYACGLRPVGTFSHTLSLSLRGVSVVRSRSWLGTTLGRWIPPVASFIGLVYRKDSRLR